MDAYDYCLIAIGKLYYGKLIYAELADICLALISPSSQKYVIGCCLKSRFSTDIYIRFFVVSLSCSTLKYVTK